MTKDLTDQAILEIIEVIKQTKDFAKEQAPLVATEMLRWGAVQNIGLAVFFFVLAISGFVSAKHWARQNELSSSCDYMPGIFFSCAAALLSIIAIVVVIGTAIQIKIAPRVYLLEHLICMARRNH